MTTFAETALPVLVFTVPAGHPKGTADALGRLTINEAQGAPQSWFVWGMETNDRYTHTDSLGPGALFYESGSRTLLSGSTVVTVAGASSGQVVQSPSLPTFDVPVMSTQTAGSSVHLAHVGSFRVFARVMNTAATTGSVTFGFDWAVGDFASYTRNTTITLTSDLAGTYRLCDLGIVTIPKPATGAQRWEGRFVAHASAGDALRIDCLFLVPIDTASGEATITTQAPPAAGPTVYDLFDQAAGALTGKTTTSGAVWTAFGGDVDDWSLDTANHIATRTAISDSIVGTALNAGRHVTAGTAAFTTLTASVDIMWSSTPTASNVVQTGITFRGVDWSNFGRITITYPSAIGYPFLRHYRRLTNAPSSFTTGNVGLTFTANVWYTMTVTVDTTGLVRVWWNRQGAPLGGTALAFRDTLYATGGPLASGKVGLYDDNEGATVFNRYVDNFAITVPSTIQDAVMFSGQSAEIRHDGVIREDATGAFWQPMSIYNGDLLRIPAAGREGRSVRFVVKASRSVPGAGPDSAIDDIHATLAVTPRYLGVPGGPFMPEPVITVTPPSGALTAPVNTVIPVISGAPIEGQTITVDQGTWTGTTPIVYTYQWQTSPTGSVWTNINGATNPTYVIPVGDVGKFLRGVVNATNVVGAVAEFSAATDAVLPIGAPFVNDTFTGPTSTIIETRAGETGATWTKQTASTGSGSDVIQNNRAMGPLGSGTNIYHASGTPPTANYEVTASIVELSDNNSSHFSVAGRMSTTSNTHYYVSYSSSSNACTLSVFNAGVNTVLASSSILATTSLTLRMVGDQISGLVDGVLVYGPVTDATITTAGRAGFRHGGFNNTGAGIHVNSIQAVAI